MSQEVPSHSGGHVLADDPALWPKDSNDKERCSIVQKGPVQLDIDFHRNPDGRRFVSQRYHMVMRNGEKNCTILASLQ